MTLPGRLSRVAFAIVLSFVSIAFAAGCDPSGDDSSTVGDGATSDGQIPAGDDTEVGRIVDGDTLRTVDDVRIRLLNIDTPEPSDDECWSDEASARLHELVPPGTRIRLVYDRERLDRYGRTLAHVYRHSDGMWVNHQLALDGAALPYVLRPNNERYQPIVAAADDARAAGRGLWGACPTG